MKKFISLVKTQFPRPRWSPDASRVAVIEMGPRGAESMVRVATRNGERLFEVEGAQFAWTADGGLIVDAPRITGKRVCHSILRVDSKGAVEGKRETCAADNAWLPSWGYPDSGVPPVMIRLERDVPRVTVFWLDEKGRERGVTRVTLTDSPLMQAIACAGGVTLSTNPIVSLVRSGEEWTFARADVCGLGENIARLRARRGDVVVRRLLTCRAAR